MMSSALASTNGNATQPWLRETVQAFFEGVVWSGAQPHLASASSQHGTEGSAHAESNMTMTVSHFFEAISWEGQPTIGVPIAPIEAPTPVETTASDLTLDDFSSLFG